MHVVEGLAELHADFTILLVKAKKLSNVPGAPSLHDVIHALLHLKTDVLVSYLRAVQAPTNDKKREEAKKEAQRRASRKRKAAQVESAAAPAAAGGPSGSALTLPAHVVSNLHAVQAANNDKKREEAKKGAHRRAPRKRKAAEVKAAAAPAAAGGPSASALTLPAHAYGVVEPLGTAAPTAAGAAAQADDGKGDNNEAWRRLELAWLTICRHRSDQLDRELGTRLIERIMNHGAGRYATS